MIHLLLDIAPLPEERRHWEVVERTLRQAADTVDTITGVASPVADNVSGGGHGSLWAIIGAIAAALAGLAILFFMVRVYRSRGEQQQSFGCASECA